MQAQPGAYLYFLPLGGGVSKNGGAHRWSDPTNSFWCCVGSAVEAFGRLHHGVFWRRAPDADAAAGAPPAELFVLSLVVPAAVRWAARGVCAPSSPLSLLTLCHPPR